MQLNAAEGRHRLPPYNLAVDFKEGGKLENAFSSVWEFY